MYVSFRPSAEQKAERDALESAQQDATSSSFRKWLTPEEYGARFGATDEALAVASNWLRSQGFTVGELSRARTRVFFTGTVSQVERAFQAEMHRYDVNGTRHFGLSSAARVPAAIGERLLSLHGVDDFRMQPPKHTLTPQPDYTHVIDAGPPLEARYALAPEDFAKEYGLTSLYSASPALNGAGISIAIIGESYYNATDISGFRTRFGLPATTIDDVLVPGSGNQTFDPNAQPEAELDLEWSGAVAPGAKIRYVYTGDNQNAGGALDAMFYALDESIAPIVSASFSACEDPSGWGASAADLTAFFTEIGAQANLEGITFVAASGDTGPGGCEPNNEEASSTGGLWVGVPASMPGVTAVGGTSVSSDATYWNAANDTTGGSLKGLAPETSFNDTFNAATPAIFASGGGASTLFTKPIWQTGVGVPSGNTRFVPDVALSAGSGNVPYLVEFSYTIADGADGGTAVPLGLYGFGGTSCGTPAFAGILAIANQALLANGNLTTAGLGNVNPVLYALGSTSSAFRDITTGNSCIPCDTGSPDCPATAAGPCGKVGEYGFAAGVGYDEVTGLGSINAANLVSTLKGLIPTSTALTVTPTTADVGATVTLDVAVSSTGKTKGMGGSVSFYDQNGDQLGAVAVTASTTAAGDEQGKAELKLSNLPAGADQIFAAYSGDVAYLGSFTKASTQFIDDAGDWLLDGGIGVQIGDASQPGTPEAGPIPDANAPDSSPLGSDAGEDAGSEDSGPATTPDSGPITTPDSGPITTPDSGPISSEDSGFPITTPVDASSDDGGPNNSSGSSSGCGCRTAGNSSESSSGFGGLGAALLGAGVFVRRRRNRK